MAIDQLATYLNDHLSGSVAALGLLEHLAREHEGEPVGDLAVELRAEIGEERATLEELMARLGVGQSLPRKATAWLSGRMADLKLRLDDPGGGELRLLEILEAISLGIEGKHSLWRSLEAASDVCLPLRPTDFATLKRRSEDQRGRVEPFRLKAAKAAFGSEPIGEKV